MLLDGTDSFTHSGLGGLPCGWARPYRRLLMRLCYRWIGIVALLGVWALLPGRASAQGTVVCESEHGRRNYCAVGDARGGVEMVRQLGGAPCERGRSWGFDGRGIWVDHECKAEFRVLAYGGHGPAWWNSGGERPHFDWKDGACFYSDANFSGEYFCLRRGERYESLPAGFNDRISSIQIIGHARVTVFNDDDFRGINLRLKSSADNLKRFRKQDDPNRTWNDRISSIRVD